MRAISVYDTLLEGATDTCQGLTSFVYTMDGTTWARNAHTGFQSLYDDIRTFNMCNGITFEIPGVMGLFVGRQFKVRKA